jgi:hypothetical protein
MGERRYRNGAAEGGQSGLRAGVGAESLPKPGGVLRVRFKMGGYIRSCSPKSARCKTHFATGSKRLRNIRRRPITHAV